MASSGSQETKTQEQKGSRRRKRSSPTREETKTQVVPILSNQHHSESLRGSEPFRMIRNDSE